MLEGRTRSPSWHTLYRTKRGPSQSYCQSWEASGLRFYPSRGALEKRTPSCSHPFGELSRPPLFPGPYGHWLVDSREYNDGNDGDSHITVLEYVCFFLLLFFFFVLTGHLPHLSSPARDGTPTSCNEGKSPQLFFLHFNYVHTQNMLFVTSEIKNTKLTICS